MIIRLIAVGTKMPEWIQTGFEEYAKRLPSDYALQLHEIPAEKRTKQANIPQLMEREGEKILSVLKPHHLVIALHVTGQAWTTPQLAKQLQNWHGQSQNVDLLVGGPDGLSVACLAKANLQWSLSALTLPHPLVRVVVAEQIYRAFSIIQNHPYHR